MGSDALSNLWLFELPVSGRINMCLVVWIVVLKECVLKYVWVFFFCVCVRWIPCTVLHTWRAAMRSCRVVASTPLIDWMWVPDKRSKEGLILICHLMLFNKRKGVRISCSGGRINWQKHETVANDAACTKNASAQFFYWGRKYIVL